MRLVSPLPPAAALAALLLLSPPAAAAPQKAFDEVTDVIEVEIPVHVVANGEPVRGLTADDFEIHEGRRQHRISGFDTYDLSLYQSEDKAGGAAAAAADLPPAARRHILLLFDLTFARPASIVRAREAAREVVLEDLHPGDLVAVATYAVRRGSHLILGFTPDRQQVELALDSLGLPQLIERVNDPLGLVLADTFIRSVQVDGKSYLSNAAGGSLLDPNKPGGANREALLELINNELLDQLRDTSAAHQRAERSVQRGFAISFTEGLASLGSLLASVEGEKQVILLSEGFDSSLLLGTSDETEVEEQATSASFGEYWNVDSDKRFGSTAGLQVVEQMAAAFRRSNATIHAVDIGGLRAAGDVAGGTLGSAATYSGEDSLFVLADSTGGELFRNFNDLGTALERLVDQTGVTYLLRFQPGKIDLDGSYHPIEVRLKNSPRGTRVNHRPGYFAPKPAAYQHPLERRLSAADLVLRSHDSGPIASAVLAAAFPRAGATPTDGEGESFVPVLVQIDGEDLLAGRTQGLASLELYAYAFDRDGRVGDFFSQSLGLDVAKVREQLRRGSLDFYGQLDLAPGDYALRVLLQDSTTGRWSFRRIDLSVPGSQPGEPALLALLFPDREEGRRLLVRQQVGEDEASYPFRDRDGTFLPATRPVLTGGGATDLYLVTSEPMDHRPTVAAWVSGPGGERVAVPTVVVDAPEGAAAESPLLPIRLQASGLAAGDYTLTVSLQPGQGEPESTHSIPVTILASTSR